MHSHLFTIVLIIKQLIICFFHFHFNSLGSGIMKQINCIQTYLIFPSSKGVRFTLLSGNVVSSSWDGTLRLWCTDTLTQLAMITPSPSSSVTSSNAKHSHGDGDSDFDSDGGVGTADALALSGAFGEAARLRCVCNSPYPTLPPPTSNNQGHGLTFTATDDGWSRVFAWGDDNGGYKQEIAHDLSKLCGQQSQPRCSAWASSSNGSESAIVVGTAQGHALLLDAMARPVSATIPVNSSVTDGIVANTTTASE